MALPLGIKHGADLEAVIRAQLDSLSLGANMTVLDDYARIKLGDSLNPWAGEYNALVVDRASGREGQAVGDSLLVEDVHASPKAVGVRWVC